MARQPIRVPTFRARAPERRAPPPINDTGAGSLAATAGRGLALVNARVQATRRAAISTYVAQLEVTVRARSETIAQDNRDNPAAMKAAFQGLREELAGDVIDAARPQFDLIVGREEQAGLALAGRVQAALALDAARASASDQVSTKIRAAERFAFTLEDDDQAAEFIETELQDLGGLLRQNGPKGAFIFDGQSFDADPSRSGAFSVQDIEKIEAQALGATIEARLLGRFDRVTGIAAKEDFIEAFRDDFKAGEVDISLGGMERLEAKMQADVRSLRVVQNGEIAALRGLVRQTADHLKDGFTLPEQTLDGLETAARAQGADGLVEQIAQARGLSEFQFQIRQLVPADLQAVINDERSAIAGAGGEASFETAARLELAEKLLSTMRTELARDPVSFAARVGVAPVAPLTLAGEAAGPSMADRRKTATAIAEYYGIRPTYLTDEEATQVEDTYRAGDFDTRLGILNAISTGFGEVAPDVFRQISKNAPDLAHAGALTAMGRFQASTARLMVEGAQATLEGNDVLPPALDILEETAATMGGALGADSQARASTISAARSIYTALALQRGLGKTADFDADLWDFALQRSIGASFDTDGNRFGGFETFRDQNIVIPSDVAEGEFGRLWQKLTDEDLETASVGGGAPRDRQGRAIKAEDFRDQARLVTLEDGVYGVEIGDGLVAGTGADDFYELDFGALVATLRARKAPRRGFP